MSRFLPSRRYKSGVRWCFFRWTDVDPEGNGIIYLTRFHIFQTPWGSCMLHWLHRPDPQPDLHDHPNDFISILLRGHYIEEKPEVQQSDKRTSRLIRFINFVRAEDQHRIVNVGERTLTLVFASRVRRQWGFWVNGNWVYWREYKYTAE